MMAPPSPHARVLLDWKLKHPQSPIVPSVLPLWIGEVRLAGVLDHLEVVLFGNRHDPVHVAGLAHHVNRHDGPGVFGDSPFDVVRIELIGGGIQVGQHRERPAGQDRGDGARIRVGRGDDFVARADAQGLHAGVKRLGSGARGDAEICPRQLGVFLFKRGHSARFGLDSAPDPALGGVDDGFDDILVPVGPFRPLLVLPDRRAAEDSQLASIAADESVARNTCRDCNRARRGRSDELPPRQLILVHFPVPPVFATAQNTTYPPSAQLIVPGARFWGRGWPRIGCRLRAPGFCLAASVSSTCRCTPGWKCL